LRTPPSPAPHCSAHHPPLHSFPTRRSSDLYFFLRDDARGIVFLALSILTKYFAVAVVPLMGFYYWHRRDWRRLSWLGAMLLVTLDRKSTRLNSSHGSISYAVFCLKIRSKHV